MTIIDRRAFNMKYGLVPGRIKGEGGKRINNKENYVKQYHIYYL